MASNTTLNTMTGGDVVADKEITHDGDTAKVQLVQRTGIDGSEGSYTAIAESKGAIENLNTAHDAADAGNPLKIGHKTIAHGTNPTAVAAADRSDWYANRHGIPFVMGGHPNIKTFCYNTTGAQTDDPLIAVVSSGTKIVVTRLTAVTDEATTVGVAIRIGFGTANVPALGSSGADGTLGILMSHPGLVPGTGMNIGDGSGILGVGADDEDLRITCEAPTSGRLDVMGSYYTIES